VRGIKTGHGTSFNKIFAALAHKGGRPERVMIDATHLKAHRTAASLLKNVWPAPFARGFVEIGF
jgi:hypothetical protein